MWRNRGRTILSASAIFASTMIVCFVLGFQEGFVRDMKANVTSNLTGDIRIMNREYVKNERVTPLQFFIEGTEEILAALERNPDVGLATPKSDFGVSIYRDGAQTPARAIGLDFSASRIINRQTTKILSGVVPKTGTNEIMISAGLAEELALKPGDRLTVMTRTAISGTNGRSFTISGVLLLADSDFKNRVIFMDWKTAGGFLRMGDNALQIQVFLNPTKESKADNAIPGIRAAIGETDYDPEALDVSVWYSVNGLYSLFKMADVMYLFIGGIFFFLASTVIFNTTMMSVLERKKEIGTLGALGMEKEKIHTLFLLESLWIAVLGTVTGIAAGLAVLGVMGQIGFDFAALGGKSMTGMSASEVIYPYLEPLKAIQVMLLGIIVTGAACYMPARMATKVEAAEALRDK